MGLNKKLKFPLNKCIRVDVQQESRVDFVTTESKARNSICNMHKNTNRENVVAVKVPRAI